MASKSTKLFDVKNKLLSTALKTANFVTHSLLRRKKEVLIIGDPSHPVVLKFSQKIVQGNWNVTLVGQLQQNQPKQIENRNISFFPLNDNYQQIQTLLSGKRFNSIMVPPLSPTIASELNFQEEDFVFKYPHLHYKLMMQNVLAYRLAHKYLAKTGVVVLSCGQKQFIEYKKTQRRPTEDELIHELYAKDRAGSQMSEMLSYQVANMGVVIGDREHTHLSSQSVIALSNQLWEDNLDLVVDRYLTWVQQKNMPYPGSFALFKPPFAKSSTGCVQYL